MEQMNKNNQQKRKKIKTPDPMGNPLAMGRYGIKVIKDIAFGNCVNIEEQIEKFGSSRTLIRSTMQEVDEKIMDAYLVYNALYPVYINKGNENPRIGYLLNKYYKTWEGWNLVNKVLTQIYNTEDGSALYVLANRLPAYKYYL